MISFKEKRTYVRLKYHIFLYVKIILHEISHILIDTKNDE